MRKRILVIMHMDLVPPQEVSKEEAKDPSFEFKSWITEYNVITTLKALGHEVVALGLYSDLKPLRDTIDEFKPHVVFNLLEEFDGQVLMDQNIVSYLELLKVKYTGCNPRGLMIARDKALAKKLLLYHRIKTPRFQVFGRSKKMKLDKKLRFPLIVKYLYEEASLCITKASIVNNEEKLYERVNYLIDKYNSDVIVEEFIEGREFYVGIMGSKRLKVLPTLELKFEKVENPEKELYSEKAKWSKSYREKKGIESKVVKLDESLQKKVNDVAKRTYKRLSLSGYARIDLRVNSEGEVYVLEANPNPNIAMKDEFAMAAKEMGLSYKKLLSSIL